MDTEKNIFTLENYKFAKMGPDYIVIIPRSLIKHKFLNPEDSYNIHFELLPES